MDTSSEEQQASASAEQASTEQAATDSDSRKTGGSSAAGRLPEIAFQLNGVPVADTFAEAFPMVAARLLITAATAEWARIAAVEATGFATSVIACSAEAAIEAEVPADETPDGRPGISVLVFSFGRKGLAQAVVDRVGQCVLTCPTTACYNGLPEGPKEERILVGGQLRFFGDGFQASKKPARQRYWRIPVMDGEFVCEERFDTVKGVGGGNLLLCGTTQQQTLAAAGTAADTMRTVPGVILPFPGGIVRSGSKVGSRYKTLKASTNHPYCPTLAGRTESALPAGTSAVYEIVVDGLSAADVQRAMHVGLHAAAACPGLTLLTAGNYGGQLGKHHFHLRELQATP
ncbi:MAG: formylmethanofuran--tetrahydromethanopterin N-formyltransferase [Planctomycetaceae bacterium]|nr:formylmethanofuran--tetrahydromethanopterin N-formyltransferase [Planctomycetaceae bacterium]